MAEDLDDPPSREDRQRSQVIDSARTPELEHSEAIKQSIEKEPKAKFFVALASRPKGYKPGQGPPLQPLRLVNPIDSSAYIVDRILLPSPGLAADGRPLPKRMTYLIGWRDMPAASLLVPAMQVLDYVSSRVLEDWEDKLEAELDEERARIEEEKNRPPFAGEPKERTRPPADHTDIVPAVAVEAEPHNDVRPKGGAMSLSTPQKRKREDFEGLSGDESSPSNQIARELFEEHKGNVLEESEQPSSRDENFWGIEGKVSGTFAAISAEHDTAAAMTEHTPALVPGIVEDSSPEPPPPKNQKALLVAAQGEPDDSVVHSSRGSSSATDNAVCTATKISGFKPFNARNAVRTEHEPVAELSLPVAVEARNPVKKSKPAAQPARKKPAAQKKPTKKRARTPPLKEVDEHGEAAWEVERLEDMAMYEVEGRGLARYFKVRWAGDWPADQNPSWEPEDNLPERLVKNYRKRSKKRSTKPSSSAKPQQPPKPTLYLDNPFKSVADAFTGDVDDEFYDELVPENHTSQAIYLSDGAGYESELFLIEEQKMTNKKAPAALKAK